VALVGLFATVVALLAIVLVVVDRDRRYQALLAAGDRELASGNAVDAAASYSSALGLRPDSMAAYLRRGQAYRAEHRDLEAIHDWHEAAKLARNSTQPLEMLGDILSSRGDDAEAATYFERAVQLDPADATKLYKLGLARYRAGLAATAVGPLQSAVALNDNFAEAYYLLGLVLRDVQRQTEAVVPLERAVRISPSLIAAHEELADLYRSLGRPVDELAQLQTLSSLDASLPREVAIALAESRHGRFDGAIATLSAAADDEVSAQESDEALHKIRKRAKQLRYTAAALGVEKVAERAKAIQSLLGDHQDSVVSRTHLSQEATVAHRAGEDTFTYGVLFEQEADLARRSEEQLDAALKQLKKAVRDGQ